MPIRFFAFHRPGAAAAVTVSAADTMAGLPDDPSSTSSSGIATSSATCSTRRGRGRGRAWFAEVKDFLGHRIANKGRLSTGDLACEVAEKVRDTLAALAWACDRQGLDAGDCAIFLSRIAGRDRKVPVVLSLEEDRPLGPQEVSSLAAAIKRRLAWLNPRVLVTSRLESDRRPLEGLSVAFLRRPS